ncbi:conserved Plasmodium protein, unknown function [Plasmodium vinckei vinckei]|uniref:Fam-a protein n=1 Tax=Plasmodium vinckei vinckei TaxID=54757 RepID=A0A449BZ56_PLAVN|nr:conserved Plasmodium protein, unknown function [Plasmodium vinckei vinckei]VEV58723.1 conserved Plasmodium protein, unknown function [Plasmodium vinckei vinckei]
MVSKYLLLLMCIVLGIHAHIPKKNSKKGNIEVLKKKVSRYAKNYKKSYLLKDDGVLGTYKIDAYVHCDDDFEKEFKWNIYRNSHNGNNFSLRTCRMKRKFNKAYDDDSFSVKKIFSNANIIYQQFVRKFSVYKFNITLKKNHHIEIEEKKDLSNSIMSSLSNLVVTKKTQLTSDMPRWRLSFNYIRGKKKLIVIIPKHLPGVNIRMYYVIVAYRRWLFNTIGDIYIQFEGGYKKHNVGYFTMARAK